MKKLHELFPKRIEEDLAKIMHKDKAVSDKEEPMRFKYYIKNRTPKLLSHKKAAECSIFGNLV